MDSERTRADVQDDSKLDYDCLLGSISADSFKSEMDFLGSEPLTVKTTNAQDIYNQLQMYPKVLVFDLRDRKRYKLCHLKCSINLPINSLRSDSLVNFNPDLIERDYLDKDADKLSFKNRKRSMWFIVAHQTCNASIFNHAHELFDPEKIEILKATFTAEDIIATRNSILLYRALKQEKTREVYICRNSFSIIQGKYPYLCKFQGFNLYLEPEKTNGYPWEILDRRLYLGDASHAQNETIINNLGITHILNVSDSIPNKFEESKDLRITYQRINIEDNEDVPIELSFSLAYDFIDQSISTKKYAKTRLYRTRSDKIQYFKNMKKINKSMVYSASPTNDFIIDFKNKSVEILRSPLKDKISEIDRICEANIHSSNNQNRVLVHCAMGRSRSATMVIMYLMMRFQIPWDQAFDILKIRREIIDPNPGFLQKLKDFEGKQYQAKEKIFASSKFLPAPGDLSDSDTSEDLMEKKTSIDV